MKKFLVAVFASAVVVMTLSSCNKDSVLQEQEMQSEPEVPEKQEEISDLKGGDPIDVYYGIWGDVLSEIIVHCKETELNFLLGSNIPEIGVLADLDICNARGERIAFASLPKAEQLSFIRAVARTMANEQHKKADIARDVANQFSLLNEVMTICRDKVKRLIDTGASIIKILEAFAPDRGCSDFFKSFDFDGTPVTKVELPIEFGPVRPEFFSFETLAKQMVGVGKKGMVATQLPIHGKPNTAMNLSNYLFLTEEERTYIHRGVGHTNILVEDFLPTTTEKDKIFYGVELAGAELEEMRNMYSPFYLMEFKRLKFIWAPELDGSNPLTMTKVAIPEDEIDKFVEYELSLCGSPFINQADVRDWLLTKYRMPEHGFTCVGMVWYCLKHVLGIDISIPACPTVFPVNAVCSPYTDIVAIIEQE